METIIIDCDECIMRATVACNDCVVTHILDGPRDDRNPGDIGPGHNGPAEAIVFDIAEQRAVRWFAEAGLVPTLRHRAASNT